MKKNSTQRRSKHEIFQKKLNSTRQKRKDKRRQMKKGKQGKTKEIDLCWSLPKEAQASPPRQGLKSWGSRKNIRDARRPQNSSAKKQKE